MSWAISRPFLGPFRRLLDQAQRRPSTPVVPTVGSPQFYASAKSNCVARNRRDLELDKIGSMTKDAEPSSARTILSEQSIGSFWSLRSRT